MEASARAQRRTDFVETWSRSATCEGVRYVTTSSTYAYIQLVLDGPVDFVVMTAARSKTRIF
jgi:hypothetical protein